MASSTSYLCSLCKEDDVDSAAFTWCTECETFLCSECEKHHGRIKATKLHTTISTDDYSNLPAFILETSNRCSKHDLKFELFCTFHDEPCCTKCVTDTHKECRDLRHLSDILENVKSSAALSTLDQDLQIADGNFLTVEKYLEKQNTALAEQRNKCIDSIKRSRKAINIHLDKLEEECLVDVNSNYQKLKSKTDKILDGIQHRRERIKDLKEDLVMINRFATDLQSYVGAKEIEMIKRSEVSYLENLLSTKDLEEPHLDCKMSSSIQSFIDNTSSFANITVSLKSCKLTFHAREELQVHRSIPPNKTVGQINPVLKKAIELPKVGQITGHQILSDGQLLFINRTDGILILYSNEGTYTRHVMKFSTDIYDVCYIKDNTVAVTLPYTESIVIVDVSKNEEIKVISTDGTCYGIDSDGTDIVVVNKTQQSVDISDMEGKVLQRISFEGKTVDKCSYYQGKVFFTNWITHKLFCFNKNGDQLWMYEHDDICWTVGVAVDNNGIVYVACMDSQKVVIVAADGKTSRTILSGKDGLNEPFAVSIDRTKSTLLVNNLNDGRVFLYSI